MALDYAKHGIRVNAVCPAGVWTPMLRQWCAEQFDPASTAHHLEKIHPLGYCPESSVVADACVFLLSEKARFVTGHILHVSDVADLKQVDLWAGVGSGGRGVQDQSLSPGTVGYKCADDILSGSASIGSKTQWC